MEEWWVWAKECRLQSKPKAMIEGLAREHQQDVLRRAEALDADEPECPDCGEPGPRGQPEPVVLDGLRGEWSAGSETRRADPARESFRPGGFRGARVPAGVHSSGIAEGKCVGSSVGLRRSRFVSTREAEPRTDERVQWSGFGVQGFQGDVEPQVLNPEPRTLNPTNLTRLPQLSEDKCPREESLKSLREDCGETPSRNAPSRPDGQIAAVPPAKASRGPIALEPDHAATVPGR